jgi:hypothetical protein
MDTLKNVLIILLGIVIILLSFDGCNSRNKYQNSLDQILALTEANTQLQKTIDDQGREITSTQNVVLAQTDEIQAQLKEIDELKKLEQKVVFSTETKYETLTIPIYDTLIVIKMDTIEAKGFVYNDTWLNLSANILDDQVIFDSLKVFNKYNIEFGETKGGLFKKKEKMVYIRNDNPHSTTKEVASFKLEETPKWYQRGVWKVLGGGVGALLLLGI